MLLADNKPIFPVMAAIKYMENQDIIQFISINQIPWLSRTNIPLCYQDT